MKMKYYIRTLGIGIFVTALILTISAHFGAGVLTNEEIKERAKALGMVEEKQVLTDLTDNTQNKPNTPSGELLSTDKKESGEELTTKQSEPTEGAENESPDASSEEMTSEPVEEAATEQVQEAATEQAQEAASEPVEEITSEQTEETVVGDASQGQIQITIGPGDDSLSVAKKLENAGLVSNAGDYDRFLCRGGYDLVIRQGNYQIPIGSTQEAIAKMITGR